VESNSSKKLAKETVMQPKHDIPQINIRDVLKKKSGDIPWSCTSCGQMLGIVTADKTSVRIKYKDLFVFVQGGEVTTLCRKCGSPNTITDSDTEVKSVLNDSQSNGREGGET
jgi:hypothetical protein